MSRKISPSTSRPYRQERVCIIWDVPRSTYYRQKKQADGCEKRKPGPVGPCTDEKLVEEIRKVLADSPFHGEGYRKVWARLRLAKIRTSKDRVLRLMRENGLQTPGKVGNPHGPKAHDGTIITESPDEMWGTDMTGTFTMSDGAVAVMIAVDHCTCECVGLHAAKSGNRFEALEPIRQGMREIFGLYGPNRACGLSLRHDHGSAYMSDAFQKELKFLGITSSPAFVREPEGNGCAERFIRTLKEQLLWTRTFKDISELRTALKEFKFRFNSEWLVKRHGYRSPSQVRTRFNAAREAA